MDELGYWLALLHAPGVGPAAFHALLEHHGDPQALFAGGGDSAMDPGLRAYLREPDWEAVDRNMAWAGGPDRHILTIRDPLYPPQLSEVSSAPPLLFVHGDPGPLSSPQLAMVGSRNPTPQGAENAYHFARHLAGAGMAITSGLALGIDGASHRGALEGGGCTIAVAGTGLDRVYPARHRDLAHAIVEGGGALVSEFPVGVAPLPGNFPRRNRVISGLSLGTLVVEAAPRSGSLITARAASEQGREVFAIPGSIHNPLARGCHQLIRDGAKLVETASDILEELAPQLHAFLSVPDVESRDPEAPELDADYLTLLAAVDFTATPVDVLVERSGLTAEAVSSMLLIMELQGFVTSAPGGRYTRTSKRR